MSNRILYLPIASSLISLSLLEAFLYLPQLFLYIVILVNLFTVFTVFIIKKNASSAESSWNYLIFPILLMNGVISFSLFLKSDWLNQMVFILAAILYYQYLRLSYLFIFKPNYYAPSSIENFSFYGSILTFYFFSAAIFGLQSFLNVSVWQIAILSLVYTAAIVYQLFWANKISFNRGVLYILVCGFIMLELIWAISFLPFDFLISGFLATVFFYMVTGIIKMHLLDNFSKKMLKYYLSLGLLGVIIILLTSRWI